MPVLCALASPHVRAHKKRCKLCSLLGVVGPEFCHAEHSRGISRQQCHVQAFRITLRQQLWKATFGEWHPQNILPKAMSGAARDASKYARSNTANFSTHRLHAQLWDATTNILVILAISKMAPTQIVERGLVEA